MATAVMSEVNLSAGGLLVAPPLSKKPVYTVRDVSTGRPQRVRLVYREAAAAKAPRHLLLGAVCNPNLRVIRPIPVEISRRDGDFYARFKAADEFGVGTSMSSALEDLGKTVSELFLGLEENQHRLGSDLVALYKTLSRYVAKR
jgi:hypothetical protein